MTREERREYNKKYYEANKEYYIKRRQSKEFKTNKSEYNKKYYETNKEKEIERQKKYREANRDKTRENSKRYRENNKDKIKERRKKYNKTEKQKEYARDYQKRYRQTEKRKAYRKEYDKKYREEHRDELNEKKRVYVKKRLKEEPLFKLREYIRKYIYEAFNRRTGYEKKLHTEEILGCTIDEFIAHLQSKFQEGMTLENHRTMAYRSHNTYI